MSGAEVDRCRFAVSAPAWPVRTRVGARANSSVVIPGREEIDPFVGHLVDQAVFAIDPA